MPLDESKRPTTPGIKPRPFTEKNDELLANKYSATPQKELIDEIR